MRRNGRDSRRSIRLPGYDYRMPAGYFVTVCTVDREPLFGTVVDGTMQVNRFGAIVREEWFRTALVRRNVLLLEEEFVVMPNHVHGILWLTEDPPDDGPPAGVGPRLAAGSLGAIVGAFKAAAARRINRERGTPGAPVWQRNFWERIVRSDRELERIRRYLFENPLRWQDDSFHPERSTPGEALDFLVVPSEDGPSTS